MISYSNISREWAATDRKARRDRRPQADRKEPPDEAYSPEALTGLEFDEASRSGTTLTRSHMLEVIRRAEEAAKPPRDPPPPQTAAPVTLAAVWPASMIGPDVTPIRL